MMIILMVILMIMVTTTTMITFYAIKEELNYKGAAMLNGFHLNNHSPCLVHKR